MLMLGRKPRQFDPRMPAMASVRMMAEAPLPPIPPALSWSAGMPGDVGMMKNDVGGCCTIAGIYHLMQTWSFNAWQRLITEPDSMVEQAYEEFDGYDPRQDRPDG